MDCIVVPDGASNNITSPCFRNVQGQLKIQTMNYISSQFLIVLKVIKDSVYWFCVKGSKDK